MTKGAVTLPISVKGIIFQDDKVWLRKNERDEWELPGGRLEAGEQPESTVVREMREELGFLVSVKNIVQAHVYSVQTGSGAFKDILVVTYVCEFLEQVGSFELEGEAGKSEFKAFTADEIITLIMPDFYKQAILQARVISL